MTLFTQNFTINSLIVSAHYYPFGMIQPGRSFSSGSYRYGFNGQEKDNEIAGQGNSYTATYWQYDSRLARRWNLDPVPQIHISDYAVLGNNPNINIDPNGAYFFGLVGSTSEQRKSAKEFQKEHGGRIENKHKKSILVYYTEETFNHISNETFILGKEQGFFKDGTLRPQEGYMYQTPFQLGEFISEELPPTLPIVQAYATLDALWVTGQTFTLSNDVQHLWSTKSATTDEKVLSFASTALIFLGGLNAPKLSAPKSNLNSFFAAKSSKNIINVAEGGIPRIQNAANRINKPIHLVGGRANGTSKALSDFDYVIEGINSRQWSKIKNSLPGAPSRIDNLPRRIDLFRGPLDPTEPHITIYPH